MDPVDFEQQFDMEVMMKIEDRVIQVELNNEKRFDKNVLQLIEIRSVVDVDKLQWLNGVDNLHHWIDTEHTSLMSILVVDSSIATETNHLTKY